MGSKPLITILFSIFLASLPSLLHSQQPYEGLFITDCQNEQQHNSTSLLGYFCNGLSTSCQSFLTFHSQPPYNSVSTISSLLGSDPSLLSQLNSLPLHSTFPTNTLVIAPVPCSCSGSYYQSNSSFLVKQGETSFIVANNTFQGLSTCQAIDWQNGNKNSSSGYLVSGMGIITVPLRCACPTTNQTRNGVKYLLSYLVSSGDTIFTISEVFNVTQDAIFDANGLSMKNTNIYPFTTLLIPLKNQLNWSQVLQSLPPPPPSSSTNGKSSNHTLAYLGIGIGMVVVLLILSAVVFYVRLNAKRKANKSTNSNDSLAEVFIDLGLSKGFVLDTSDVGKSLKVYEFEELMLATKSFCSECRIEGSVYRGVFNGDVGAVKVMNKDVSKEINMLQKINHFNLIRLSGLCFNQGNWYLVYEYAENGSLSNWIFDRSGSMLLSWKQRIQIALDVASGLNYLHSYTNPAYVHKDIKSSNILLDGKFRGKIANFHLARAAEGKEGEFEMTRHIVGTKGYMAPEYLEHGLVSPKLDVYAFGVVMLEIITGRDAVSIQRGEDEFSLEDFVMVLSDEAAARVKVGRFIDPRMEGDYPLDSALCMARLVEGCLRKNAGHRPSMGEIVQSLSKLIACQSSSSESGSASFVSGSPITSDR